MNKEFKKLLLEAGVSENWNTADWYSLSPAMVEKFAELIVQRCISKHRELIAQFETPAPGYEHTFPEFMEGVVHGLAEGIEGIQDLFGVEG